MGIIKTIKKVMRQEKTIQPYLNEHPKQKESITASLTDNIKKIEDTLGTSSDIVIKKIRSEKHGDMVAAIIYTEGLADTKLIHETILEHLKSDLLEETNCLQLTKNFDLSVGEIKEITDFETLYTTVLSGDTVIIINGYSQGFSVSTKGWKDRGVTETSAQTVIRGPQEAFSETLRTNTALIRRKIKNPLLLCEQKQIGRVTKTDVAIMYIKGIVNDKLVSEVHARLDRIDIDAILESGYIEELIQDEKFTPFPTMYNTDRPDVVAAALLEGRIAIIVDGTPFVLLAPALFTQYFQSAEDYYQRSDLGLLRMLRYLSFFIALLGPSLYIAITTYHQEMLPTQLLLSLSAQREGVPFPAFVEALIMEVAFEILREAGVRMPRAVGQAVSIVGALVIGQAAVEAGIVSAAMVIVVSITAISSFVFPAFNLAISVRILRFGMMFLAASYGLFGVMAGLIAMVIHLNSLRSFGVPFLAPVAPFILDDQKDTIFRLPQWGLFSRPRLINQNNVIREDNPPTSKPDNS